MALLPCRGPRTAGQGRREAALRRAGQPELLGPDFWRPMIETVHGTVVECTTPPTRGRRNTTEKHRRTMIKHGWSTNFDVDILDAEGPDLELAVPNGRSDSEELRRQGHCQLRFHARPLPLQRASDGRLRRRAQAATPSAARLPTARPYIHGAGEPEKRSGLPTTTASSTRWRTPPRPWWNISRTRPFSSTL